MSFVPGNRPRATGMVLATAVISAGLSGVAVVPSAVAAPAPDPVTFTAGVGGYAGVVPDGACFVDVRVTGGAGGHNMVGGGASQLDANGAAARINARFSVVPGEAFGGFVGGGGAQERTGGINGGGSGGLLTGPNPIHPGAGGGGWTSLHLDGSDVVVAGGGGGSGGGHSLNEGGGGNAGLPNAPGVTAGVDGVDGRDSPATNVVGGGRGGGTAAPGAGGTNSADSSRNGAAGSGRTGGDAGSDATPDTGGGGGGGWFGAGGAASTVLNGGGGLSVGGVTGAGGGGGASYVAPTSPGPSGAAVTGISSTAVGERATEGDGQDGDVVLDFVPCTYDLVVSKSVDDATPAPGETVTWTIVATNQGPDPMTRGDLLTIGDNLPGPGAKTVTSVTASGGSNDRGLVRGPVTCDVSAGSPMPATVTCSRPYADDVASSLDVGTRGLDAGESVTIVYTQTIPGGTPGATFTNVATVTDRSPNANNTDDAAITVTPGPPVANDDSANTPFNTPVTLEAVTDDAASDPGTPLVPAATVFTSGAATNGGKTLVTPEGTWQVNADGSVTFTPAPGYVGTTPPVEYRITDEAGGTDTADLVVTVRPGPSATPDTGTTPQDTNITVPLLPNDTPGPRADGTPGSWDPATVRFTSPNATNGGRTLQVPGQGVYTIDPVTGAVTFDPEPGFTGKATPVEYQVTDSNGNTARSTLTITVTPTPVVPTPTPTPTPDESFDLVLDKRVVGGAQAKVGDKVRYRLQVSNKGQGAARGSIKLTDPLPQGLELVSAEGKGWKCKVRKGSDTVKCVRKRGLGADRKASPVFVVAVATKAALGRVVNVAKVEVAGESVRSNNRGTAVITVVPAQLPSTGFRFGRGGLL